MQKKQKVSSEKHYLISVPVAVQQLICGFISLTDQGAFRNTCQVARRQISFTIAKINDTVATRCLRLDNDGNLVIQDQYRFVQNLTVHGYFYKLEFMNMISTLNLLPRLIYLDLSRFETQFFPSERILSAILSSALAQLTQLTQLKLPRHVMHDDCLAALAHMTQLIHLDLDCMGQFTHDNATGLSQLTQLTHLDLGMVSSGFEFLPMGVAPLTNLSYLKLGVSGMVDEKASTLVQLRKLTHLFFFECSITSTCIKAMAPLTSLVYLRLHREGKNDDEGIIQAITETFPKLTNLDMCGSRSKFESKHIRSMVANLGELRELTLPQRSLSSKELALLAQLPHLTLRR